MHCSFCGKTRSEVRKLISGPNVYICDECVGLCDEIIGVDEQPVARGYPKPSAMLEALDRYVIGQSTAKRVLSVAVYNHYKRISYRPRPGDVELAKGNILLIGPTGCGKTLLAQTLAKKLDVPFAMADATTLTEAGYVGEDVESVVKALYHAADGDPDRAAHGIICIDEVDKLACRGSGPSMSRDVSGEGVQQALLKLLEGRKATITPEGARNRPQQELIQVDTRNVLFILTGAFNGIEELVSTRIGAQGVGFGATVDRRLDDANELRAMVGHEDLQRFGLIPEFMGRIPVVISCDELDEDALVKILWEPKNALVRQYQRLLSLDGVNLEVKEGAMRAMASEAFRRRSGARGLRSIIEEVMLDVMYELPSLDDVVECVLHADCIEKREPPRLVRKKAS
ncbi:MAG: ATP-dependent Clp protease ATP-binding subunit ClpX [Proteobacteria bacterium]|nr:MAG: ATP-dependent Clp protease ATP-binding subunit ClpX [Pseudomonadota bacterium]PIE19039.1 MAG: ATP-dependent Clp protease ATP-binding subunit ClpX [Pseudomonadota bacterium]